jgi:hypothetical protein
LEYLIALLLGVFGSLIAWEISLHYRHWCEAIIRSAVGRLPDDQQPIRREEWLAALNDCVGLISSFSHAAGCWVGAPAVAAAGPKTVVRATKDSTDKRGPTIRIEIAQKIIYRRVRAKDLQDAAKDMASAAFDDIAGIGFKSAANIAWALARVFKILGELLGGFMRGLK